MKPLIALAFQCFKRGNFEGIDTYIKPPNSKNVNLDTELNSVTALGELERLTPVFFRGMSTKKTDVYLKEIIASSPDKPKHRG
jgi:hypothetical protein